MNPLHNYYQWKRGSYAATVEEWEDWAERIVATLQAEMRATENDYNRYKQLKEKNNTLRELLVTLHPDVKECRRKEITEAIRKASR